MFPSSARVPGAIGKTRVEANLFRARPSFPQIGANPARLSSLPTRPGRRKRTALAHGFDGCLVVAVRSLRAASSPVLLAALKPPLPRNAEVGVPFRAVQLDASQDAVLFSDGQPLDRVPCFVTP